MSERKYFSFILIFLSLCNSMSELILQRNEFDHLNNSQLQRFFSYYNNHSFVIHNNALDVLNMAQFVNMLPTYHMVGEDNTLIKPAAKNTVNIFSIQNISASGSFPHTLRVFNEDGCNLFLTNEISQEMCSMEIVQLAPASFVFDVRNNQLSTCFTENEELNLTLVSEEKYDNLLLYHRSFRDLGGRKIKVYFLNNQATLCRAIVNGSVVLVRNGTCKPTGAEANLVRTLGRKFNFTPEFWLFPFKSDKTLWSEIIDAVGRGEAEFAAGSLVLAEDGRVYYTTFTHTSSEFVVLYVNPIKQLNLGKILISFHFIVYVIAVMSLFSIMILIIVFTYLFEYRDENGRFIFILLKMIVEQGSNISDGLYSFITTQLVIFLWLFLTIIFCSVIKSQISSIMIKPETYDFRTVADLSRNGFIFTTNSGLKKTFQDKFGYIGLNIIGMNPWNFEDAREICPSTRYLFQYRYAFVHAEFDLLAGIRMCINYFPKDRVQDLRFFTYSNIYYALAMNPLTPYKKQFTLNMDWLKSSGILTNWYDYVSRSVLKRLSKEYTLARPLDMDQVFNIFILLLVGMGIGFLVLILEITEATLNRRYNMNVSIMNKL